MQFDQAKSSPAQGKDEPILTVPLAGTRAQAIQRLQVGVAGLAAMVLLVGLANIIIASAEQSRSEVVPESVTPMPSEGEDPAAPVSNPLADAGVVPDMPAEVPDSVRVDPVDPELLGDALEPAP